MEKLKDVLSKKQIEEVMHSFEDEFEYFQILDAKVTTDMVENIVSIPSDREGRLFAGYYFLSVLIVEVNDGVVTAYLQ